MPFELRHGGLDVQAEPLQRRADPRRCDRFKDEVTPRLPLSQRVAAILRHAQAGS
jgi:hypothetical protein